MLTSTKNQVIPMLKPKMTKDYYSPEMYSATDLGMQHISSIAGDRENQNKSVSTWSFQTASWDPCQNMDSWNSLRKADANLVLKNKALYASRKTNDSSFVSDNTLTKGTPEKLFNFHDAAKLR